MYTLLLIQDTLTKVFQNVCVKGSFITQGHDDIFATAIGRMCLCGIHQFFGPLSLHVSKSWFITISFISCFNYVFLFNLLKSDMYANII